MASNFEKDGSREQVFRIQEIILADPVALATWPRMLGRIVRSAQREKTVRDLFDKGKHDESVRLTLEFWFSDGLSLEELVRVFREEFHLTLLTEKLSQQFPKRAAAGSVRPIWFQVGKCVQNFTGREADLKTLHEKVERSYSTEHYAPIVVSGLGGIGKSTLVRKYAYQNREFFDGNVVWIDAENTESMKSSFIKLAKKLDLKIDDEISNKKLAATIYDKFTTKKSLFIFDNVESLENVNEFMPVVENPDLCTPAVVMTSRRSDLVRMPWQHLQLSLFSVKEAMDMIQSQVTKSDDVDAQKLADELHCLPLALQQALAYIHERYGDKVYSVPRYLQEFEKATRVVLSDERFKKYQNDESHLLPVLTTWNITLERIKKIDTIAAELLNVTAYLNPNNITTKFLTEVFSKADGVETSLRTLEKYSMINENDGQISVHRLVQKVIKLSLSKAEELSVLKKIVLVFKSMAVLSDSVLVGDREYFAEKKAHLLHALPNILKHPEFKVPEFDFLVEAFSSSPRILSSEPNTLPTEPKKLRRI